MDKMTPKPNRSVEDELELLHQASFLRRNKVMCYADGVPKKGRRGGSNNGVVTEKSKEIMGIASSSSHTSSVPQLRRRSTSSSSLTTSSSVNSLGKISTHVQEENTRAKNDNKGINGTGFHLKNDLLTSSSEELSQPKTNYSLLILIPLVLVLSYGTLQFSLFFPFVMAPYAATETYRLAHYHYDAEYSHFDNTVWTYGTDYFLMIIMTILSYRCFTAGRTKASLSLRLWSFGLLACYAISVFAGGYAHQFYLTVESRNTIYYRLWWTLCVGTVTAASTFMGACGNHIARSIYSSNDADYHYNISLPIVPDWFWIVFGSFVTLVCIMGGISFQRPACDIFIAGTTQFTPTAYCILHVFLRRWPNNSEGQSKLDSAGKGEDAIVSGSKSNGTERNGIKNGEFSLPLLDKDSSSQVTERVREVYRLIYYVGFLLNAPLLPMYPLLIQYTDWTLGSVNTLLHSWLLVAWSMQAISLRHFSQALDV